MIRYERSGRNLVATSDVLVGVGRVTLSVQLGAWRGHVPDAAGLRGAPVVVVPNRDLADVAVAGIRRSGRLHPVVADARAAGVAAILRAGAEAGVLTCGGARTLEDVRALGGRPIPALPLDDAPAVAAFLQACRVDLDLALPSATDEVREAARAALDAVQPLVLHHVVEVDPRPAFDELGTGIGGATLGMLAAGASGVLAGRVSAGNRRWRAPS